MLNVSVWYEIINWHNLKLTDHFSISFCVGYLHSTTKRNINKHGIMHVKLWLFNCTI
jgi:hypothetical protein